ncbi:ATP-binding protein [Vibrio breoganii]|uniref:ATP-binding protein n=1 Tax=Vibrio breoganii TaxID=553239 RepID=UPI001F539174|nr:SbcC/MukB-like Walker B domain-containing protein [Vibrio breoganii]
MNLRERLCEALEVDEETLPFVGELVQVKSSQSLWQGAIERVLHNFALSLLVPPHLYQQVSEFVENNHLGTRLVYYRIQEHSPYQALSPQASSLLGKIEIKSDSHYYPWLFQELSKRFDYQCCEKMEDFRRSERAITPSGQIKASKSRHEKDDRYKIQDKSRYVLGWSNQEKLALLETQYKQLSVDIGKIEQQVQTHKRSKEALASKTYSARTLAEFDFSFEQIHWLRFSQAIDELEQEKQQLEQSSNVLSDLKHRLSKEQHSAGELGQKFQHTLIEIGKCEESLEADNTKLKDKKQHLESVPTTLRERYFSVLDDFYQTYLTHSVLRINMLENVTSELRRKLNEKIQHLEDKRRKKQAQMTTAMGDFANQFPNDVLELDRSIEALPEYQQKLTALIEEDLPRHEANFKQMLNRDTIRAMALFSSYLDRQQEQIDARIRLINQALHDLDYQVGTYIEIDSIASHDIEVRDFKQRLKHCIEFSTDDSLYSEEKFERVKDLIEQMRNDPKWTKKVVDVRYWQLFNVVERYREDHSEKECYSDSGGKSGGQKEKLAYSILAAAILLQYGLVAEEQDNSKRVKRRFNLVVIDEAFARGSKDSTRFGLELFKRLGLQLLLVTPLQKLDVIEHYVQHVHFVDQRNNRSMLLNMTIEEYRDRLTQHAQLQRYRNVVKEQGAE